MFYELSNFILFAALSVEFYYVEIPLFVTIVLCKINRYGSSAAHFAPLSCKRENTAALNHSILPFKVNLKGSTSPQTSE